MSKNIAIAYGKKQQKIFHKMATVWKKSLFLPYFL